MIYRKVVKCDVLKFQITYQHLSNNLIKDIEKLSGIAAFHKIVSRFYSK
jgi:hypothetical protein